MNNDAMNGTVIADGVVKPDWIDVNDHMNVAWYVLAFDRGVDALWDKLGITSDYIESTGGSTFAVESHVTYQRELLEGDKYLVAAQILAFDEKRIHQFQWLYHADEGYLAATAEWMNLHVDLGSRRVSPWPDSILAEIERFSLAQEDRTVPPELCGHMKIKRPIFSILTEAQ